MTASLALKRAARPATGAEHVVVGRWDDPAERQADRFAERVTGQRVLRHCIGCGNQAIGRHLVKGLSSPGESLAPSLRERLEPELGADLSAARVHVDADAAASARAVGARAYALGADVVFAGGAYSPGTADGMRLLAHELAHVAQAAGDPAPVLRREGDPAAPPPPAAGQEYDPCGVEVGPLTNQALVEQVTIVRNYLNARQVGQDRYYDYANLARRLGEERMRRIGMGHLWLGQDGLTAVPENLLRLDSAPGYMMTVLPADVASERGAPTVMSTSSVVTKEQFDHLLEVKQIPSIDADEYFRRQDPGAVEPLRFVLPAPPEKRVEIVNFAQLTGLGPPTVTTLSVPGASWEGWPWPSSVPADVAMIFTDDGPVTVPISPVEKGDEFGGVAATTMVAGGRVYQSPVDITGLPSISRPVMTAGVNPASPRSVSGARANWRGAVFEQSQTGIQVLTRSDLNKLQQSFPEWDFRQTGTGNLIQRGQSQGGDWRFYQEKLQRLGGSRPATFGRAVGLVNQGFGSDVTIVDARGQSWLEVPADQVEGVRTQFRQRLAASPADWANLTDANLRANPIKVGDQTFGSFNDLEAARAANNPARGQAIDLLAERLVRPGAITMPELLGQMAFREQGVGPSGQPLTEAQYRAQVSPELQESLRLGARSGQVGAVPEPELAGMGWRSGLRGAAAGTGFAAALEALRLLSMPDVNRQALVGSGLNIAGAPVGGFISSSIEAPIVAGTDAALLGETGALAGAGRIGGRFFGGGVGGAVAAPLVTAAIMGLDPYHHYTGIDYAAKMTRSAVAGGVAGAAGAGGAALYGAAGGTEFGPPGWVVGAAIGLFVYWLTDSAVGDEVEHDVRLSLGEYGCLPTPSYTPSPYLASPFGPYSCFAGDTLITMADGSSRGIAELRTGDLVLGCDEAGELHPARVERLHISSSVPCLELRLDRRGASLKVTAAHPLFADGLWKPAGTLRAGARLLTREAGGALAHASLAVVAAIPAPLTVFNLTVDGCHTFFAEGVLAHNKGP